MWSVIYFLSWVDPAKQLKTSYKFFLHRIAKYSTLEPRYYVSCKYDFSVAHAPRQPASQKRASQMNPKLPWPERRFGMMGARTCTIFDTRIAHVHFVSSDFCYLRGRLDIEFVLNSTVGYTWVVHIVTFFNYLPYENRGTRYIVLNRKILK